MGNLNSSPAGVLQGIVRFFLRLAFLAAGLLFAALLLFAVLLLVAFWLMRAGWAKLTGRPVVPFVMRVDPRAGFSRFRDAGVHGGTPQPGEAVNDPRLADVTDVEAREIPAPPPAGQR
ncbi:MAG: hypothetical protein ABW051_06500 [Burkholderiaceae bacterium]